MATTTTTTTTLQLVPLTTALGGGGGGGCSGVGAGATFAAAQFIITSVSTDRSQKLILPKIEPAIRDAASSRGCGWAGGSTAAASKFAEARTPQRKKKSAAGSPRGGVHAIKPASVSRRNARERNRVKQVNQGFVTLASHVPPSMRSKKMSKVETLRAAIRYIGYLYDAVEQKPPRLAPGLQPDDDDDEGCSVEGIADEVAGGPSAPATTSAASAAACAIGSSVQRKATLEAPSGGGSGEEALSSRLLLLPHTLCGVAASAAADRLASALEAAAEAAAARYDVPTCLMSPAPSSAYEAPSPSGSVTSSSGSSAWGAGSSLSPSSATSPGGEVGCSSSYSNCLSPSSEELLDFANWFCTNS